jgi:hypothetical protein
MRYGINHTLTSSSLFVLDGPGRNMQAVGEEIGIFEMHCTWREIISKNLYVHNTEQIF